MGYNLAKRKVGKTGQYRAASTINESARTFAHKEPVGALFDLNVDITKMFQTIG